MRTSNCNMDKSSKIDLSVIVPVYNAEKYLLECIDSVIHQGGLCFEIIMVNDGSTDRSGAIGDQYAKRDSRIKVIHKENGGASKARNAGLDLAQGEYIAFIDSDDWIKEGSLCELYREATMYQADVVMGNIWLCHQDGSIDKPFMRITGEMRHHTLSGKEGFIRLVKTGFYLPMQFKYIYRKKYLDNIWARFEEGIICEDELWSPVVLCQAEKMIITDIDFYYYRQNDESVMNTTNLFRRMDSLFQVTDRLMKFVDRFDFSREDKALKNWWYVNVFRIYAVAFELLSGVKTTTYILPEHHLDRYWRDCWEMMPEPQKICNRFFRNAATNLKKYTDWRTSDWVASIAHQIKAGKKIMLIYNTIQDDDLSLKVADAPTDWVITTDRRYLKQADAVVFHLPGLQQELENDLDKPEEQIWISRYLESEKQHPLINDPEIRDVFDLWITYGKDEEITGHPLVSLCRQISEEDISSLF